MARYHDTPTRAAAYQAENRQRYSLYQPVNGKSHRKSSVSKHGEKVQKERELTASRASADPGPGRRRGTMRSKEHDEEEEAIQRAIEESRREVDGSGRRNGKRARDDSSEDNKHAIKRQRRTSELPPSNLRKATADDDSDDEPASRSKKAKAEAAQSIRQAEMREKEKERERARNEAASRRQDRAGRRRADDDPLDETPKPNNSGKPSPLPSSQPGSPHAHDLPERISHKKGAGKKTKKLGNNQYTKAKDLAVSSPHGRKRNGAGISSGEENTTNGDGHHLPNGSGNHSPERSTGPGKGRWGGKGKQKAVNGTVGAKNEDPADLSLGNMKRRMDAMAAFITRAQMETAGGERTPSNGEVGGAVQAPRSGVDGARGGGGGEGEKFEQMSAMEMADVVSRGIISWHRRFDHLV
ncbi:Histone deacetylase complex subunit [Saxophila tyrrhenica]|uniref:Histone deacetylase complex subunit n=1 Tax=Saxophila tyrrhenica TaxID=1690608 RepID=A0AAV9PDP1_9PEZI|nr:Histone deacetylase complex subunit [Saxophila tyrrhenica]